MLSRDFIYFDLGNVLLNFNHLQACDQIGKLAGMESKQVWNIIFEGDLNELFDLGQIDCREFHGKFVAAVGQPVDYHSFFQAYNNIFSINCSVMPLVLELAQINSKKPMLGILSNTCQSHWEYVLKKYTVLGTFFKTNVLSFQEGSCKPDSKIYQRAIEHAKTAPERIFFMDDRPENVAGAIEAGIDAVVFTSERQLRNELRIRGFAV